MKVFLFEIENKAGVLTTATCIQYHTRHLITLKRARRNNKTEIVKEEKKLIFHRYYDCTTRKSKKFGDKLN